MAGSVFKTPAKSWGSPALRAGGFGVSAYLARRPANVSAVNRDAVIGVAFGPHQRAVQGVDIPGVKNS
jgi:hypothetical protein